MHRVWISSRRISGTVPICRVFFTLDKENRFVTARVFSLIFVRNKCFSSAQRTAGPSEERDVVKPWHASTGYVCTFFYSVSTMKSGSAQRSRGGKRCPLIFIRFWRETKKRACVCAVVLDSGRLYAPCANFTRICDPGHGCARTMKSFFSLKKGSETIYNITIDFLSMGIHVPDSRF